MNAPAVIRSAAVTAAMLGSAREQARFFDGNNQPGSAAMIRILVSEIETLRETVKGSLVVVNQALADKNLATLKASTLFIVAEKIAPVLDREIQALIHDGEGFSVNFASLQALSDELHAALKLVGV